MRPLARVTVADCQRVVVARLDGEVDIASAPGLSATLAGAVTNAALGLVVDLSGVGYLDSAGIRLLFELAGQLSGHQQALGIVAPEDGPVRRVLLIVNMDAHVPLHGTVAEAVAGVRARVHETG